MTACRQAREETDDDTHRTIAAAAALLGGIAAAGVAAARRTAPTAARWDGDRQRGGIDFVAIDTDGNGSLSRAELQARATARLGRADANGDGALDRDEIVAAMPGPHGGLVERLRRRPGRALADRLLALMGATEAGQVEVAALADRRVNMLLAFADTDRDAAISQAEADAMRERRRGWIAATPARAASDGRPATAAGPTRADRRRTGE